MFSPLWFATQPFAFIQTCVSAFFLVVSDSTIPPRCLSDSSAPRFLSWPLSGIQLFSCLSTATTAMTAATTRAARLPLLSSCASASSLCVSGSGHSSNEAERKRREQGPFRKSFIGPNVAASGVSEKGVFWLTLKLSQTAYFIDKKGVWWGCLHLHSSPSRTVFAPTTAQTRVYTVAVSLRPWSEVLPLWPEWEQLQDSCTCAVCQDFSCRMLLSIGCFGGVSSPNRSLPSAVEWWYSSAFLPQSKVAKLLDCHWG